MMKAPKVSQFLPSLVAGLLAATLWQPMPMAEAIPRPDGCVRIVTSGHAFIGHDCHRAKRVTRVDHQLPMHLSRTSPRHERPIDRLLSRGDGRIKAHGDKGARQELRAKSNRHQHNRHNRR